MCHEGIPPRLHLPLPCVSRFLDGLTVLTKVLMMSLPSMLNVAALLGLLFYIFAILGMNLFGAIEPNMVRLPHVA